MRRINEKNINKRETSESKVISPGDQIIINDVEAGMGEHFLNFM